MGKHGLELCRMEYRWLEYSRMEHGRMEYGWLEYGRMEHRLLGSVRNMKTNQAPTMKLLITTSGTVLLSLVNILVLTFVHSWRPLRLLQPSATVGWNK
jgi:hypothetical protein